MTALVTKHLPLVAGAPDGIKKLRALILDLAIRGKLVQQDPEDIHAEVLLREARDARSSKQSAKKAMMSSGRTPADASLLVDLPAGWVWTTLADVALINPRNSADDTLLVSFVPMAMIGARFDSGHEQEIRTWGEVKQGFTHFAEGDVGVAKITPCFENSKACVFSGLSNGVGAGTTELHVVRPLAKALVPRYVLAYLKSPWFLTTGETKMTGTAGQKRLPKDFVETRPFPLPPLAEQHRIVTKVDELMALCDRLEADQADAEVAHAQLVQVLLDCLTQASDAADFRASWQRLSEHFHTLFTTEASIDALKQAVLQLAVMGKLVPKEANCSEWHWTTLGTLITDMDAGWSPACEDLPSPSPEIWGVLRTTAVQRMEYVEKENKQLPTHLDPRPTAEVKQGDVLFTRAGPMNRVGISCLVESTRPKLMLSDKIIRFRPKSNALDGRFTVLCLNAGATAKYLEEAKSGMAASQVNISQAKLKAAPIPTPPISEQLRIVAKVDELMALCDQLKAQLQQSRQQHAQLASVLVEQAVA